MKMIIIPVGLAPTAGADEAGNPLPGSAAFARFQSGIKDRCADGPVASDATVIGSYPGQPG
jgi:hypothetical protein